MQKALGKPKLLMQFKAFLLMQKALGKSKHRKATAFRASYPAGHSVADTILSLFAC